MVQEVVGQVEEAEEHSLAECMAAALVVEVIAGRIAIVRTVFGLEVAKLDLPVVHSSGIGSGLEEGKSDLLAAHIDFEKIASGLPVLIKVEQILSLDRIDSENIAPGLGAGRLAVPYLLPGSYQDYNQPAVVGSISDCYMILALMGVVEDRSGYFVKQMRDGPIGVVFVVLEKLGLDIDR